MFRSMMLAGGVALAAMALAPAAEAKTDVSVYFGVPFYTQQIEPDWVYSDGYGWYDADRYGDFERIRHRDRSEERSGFTIHFGVPFYSYRVGPGWRYYDGFGWYDYGRWGEFRHHNRDRLSCGDARRLVDRSGYDRVRTVECNGRTYTFRAENRRGRQVTVYVNSRTGAIWR